jgi:hypothetical protein
MCIGIEPVTARFKVPFVGEVLSSSIIPLLLASSFFSKKLF